jgi:hypothetical protein
MAGTRSLIAWVVAALGLLGLATALCGCTGAGPATAAHLELGRVGASAEFAPYADGTDVELVPGAQGGFHVWLDLRVIGMPGDSLSVTRTARRLSDEAWVLRSNPDRVSLAPAVADGTRTTVEPMRMFMCPSPVGVSVIEQPLVFHVTADGGPPDSSGASVGSVQGTVTLVPHCPKGPQQAFCNSICSG